MTKIDLTKVSRIKVGGVEMQGLKVGSRVIWVKPVITLTSGMGYAGSVYTSTVATQWYADGVAISGATGKTWTMTLAYEGKAIKCGLSNTLTLWTPRLLSGIAAIFDARQGITQASNLVSAWASQYGSLTASQTTGSAQPTYGATSFNGAPGLTFSASQSLENIALTALPANRSVIAAVNITNTNTRAILGPSVNGGYYFRRNADYTFSILADNRFAIATSTGSLAMSTPGIIASRITPGTTGKYAFDLNGASIGTGTPSNALSSTDGTMSIGRRYTAAERMAGVMSSMVIADAYLSDADTLRAEAWIARTLGQTALMTAALPSQFLEAA